MDAAACFELVISATALYWLSDKRKISFKDATKADMTKAPQMALMIEITLP